MSFLDFNWRGALVAKPLSPTASARYFCVQNRGLQTLYVLIKSMKGNDSQLLSEAASLPSGFCHHHSRLHLCRDRHLRAMPTLQSKADVAVAPCG